MAGDTQQCKRIFHFYRGVLRIRFGRNAGAFSASAHIRRIIRSLNTIFYFYCEARKTLEQERPHQPGERERDRTGMEVQRLHCEREETENVYNLTC